MKHKFYATGFVFIICIVVFMTVNAQPVSMNLRFKGTSFREDEKESDIAITIEGKRHDKLFQKNRFTGYIRIFAEPFPEELDAISLVFKKNGKAGCTLTANGKELGTLTVDKEFKHVVVELKDGTLIAAPATNIEQAKDILKNFLK